MASAAASSQEEELVPITSITRYTLMTTSCRFRWISQWWSLPLDLSMVGQPAGFETENRLPAKIAVQRGSRRMSSPRNVELANVSSRRVGNMSWNQLVRPEGHTKVRAQDSTATEHPTSAAHKSKSTSASR